MRTIQDLDQYYSLDLEKVIESIKEKKAKLVLLQFPDGLKQYSLAIVDYLEEKCDAMFLIWISSCYGACDLPQGVDNLNINLMIHFGHNALMPSY